MFHPFENERVRAKSLNLLASSSLTRLEEPTSFFINPAGDDRGDGSQGDPWATAQHAANVLCATDINGYDVRLRFAGGAYEGAAFNGPISTRPCTDGFVQAFWMSSGLATVFIEGDEADASAVSFTCIEGAMAGTELALVGSPGTAFCLKNFTLDYTTPNQNSAVISACDTALFIGDGTDSTLRFLGKAGLVGSATWGDCLNLFGNNYVSINDNIYVDGAFDFMTMATVGDVIYDTAAYEFSPSSRFAYFTKANQGGRVYFSGSFGGGPPTGRRFWCDGPGSVIDVGDIDGSSKTTLPGDTAGLLVNGASYVSATENLHELSRVPTADPHIAGALWKNAGVLTVSAG